MASTTTSKPVADRVIGVLAALCLSCKSRRSPRPTVRPSATAHASCPSPSRERRGRRGGGSYDLNTSDLWIAWQTGTTDPNWMLTSVPQSLIVGHHDRAVGGDFALSVRADAGAFAVPAADTDEYAVDRTMKRLALALWFLAAPAFGQQITAFPAASTPLAGTEQILSRASWAAAADHRGAVAAGWRAVCSATRRRQRLPPGRSRFQGL